jgi:hypothetical protein
MFSEFSKSKVLQIAKLNLKAIQNLEKTLKRRILCDLGAFGGEWPAEYRDLYFHQRLF